MTARRLLMALAIVSVPVALAAQPSGRSPGIGHSIFMRGSIVKATGGAFVLCVGKLHGAEAGQILKVYRNVEHPHGPRGPMSFMRKDVGTVRINAVIDDHYANAVAVSGQVKVNDIVELERPGG